MSQAERSSTRRYQSVRVIAKVRKSATLASHRTNSQRALVGRGFALKTCANTGLAVSQLRSPPVSSRYRTAKAVGYSASTPMTFCSRPGRFIVIRIGEPAALGRYVNHLNL